MLFEIYKPNYVVNLAAQAGVRNSITNPDDYFENNINLSSGTSHEVRVLGRELKGGFKDDGTTYILVFFVNNFLVCLCRQVPFSIFVSPLFSNISYHFKIIIV